MYCIKNECNMRFHTVVSVYVLILSYIFELSIEKFLVILLTISAVLASEMVNTTVEELSDIAVGDYSTSIKIVKDLAAGAVMISAIFSIVIGIFIFHDTQYYIKIFKYFCNYPLSVLAFALSLCISYLYVKLGPNKIKEKIIKFKLWSRRT